MDTEGLEGTARQLAGQRVHVTRGVCVCGSHSDSFVPTHLCQSQQVDGLCVK